MLPAWNDTAINALIRLSVLFVFYTIVNLIYPFVSRERLIHIA